MVKELSDSTKVFSDVSLSIQQNQNQLDKSKNQGHSYIKIKIEEDHLIINAVDAKSSSSSMLDVAKNVKILKEKILNSTDLLDKETQLLLLEHSFSSISQAYIVKHSGWLEGVKRFFSDTFTKTTRRETHNQTLKAIKEARDFPMTQTSLSLKDKGDAQLPQIEIERQTQEQEQTQESDWLIKETEYLKIIETQKMEINLLTQNNEENLINQEFKDQIKQLKQLKESNRQLREQIGELINDNDGKYQKFKILEQNQHVLEERLKITLEKNEELKKQAAIEQNSFPQTDGKTEQAHAQRIKLLDEKIQTLTKENSELQKKIQYNEKSLKDLQKKLELKNQQIEELVSKLEELNLGQTQQRPSDHSFHSLKEQIKKLKEEADQLREQFSIKEEEIQLERNRYLVEAHELKDQRKKNQQELDHAKETINEFEKQISALESLLTDQNREGFGVDYLQFKQEVQQKLELAESELKEKNKELEELKAKLDDSSVVQGNSEQEVIRRQREEIENMNLTFTYSLQLVKFLEEKYPEILEEIKKQY